MAKAVGQTNKARSSQARFALSSAPRSTNAGGSFTLVNTAVVELRASAGKH